MNFRQWVVSRRPSNQRDSHSRVLHETLPEISSHQQNQCSSETAILI
jgi:hypothetical protein